MKDRRFWLAVAGFFVATMATAFSWHMILFHEKYLAMGAFTRGEPVMPFGIAAILLQALVFATCAPYYFDRRGYTMANAIKYCLFLGITVYSVMVFATAAKFEIEPAIDFVAYGTVFQFLQFLLVGIIFGLIYRKA